MKKRLIDKKVNRLLANKCQLCGNENIDVLDNHRIKEGANGGKYYRDNVVVCCKNCHALCHTGDIEIIGWFLSTSGKVLIIKRKHGNSVIEEIIQP